MLCGGRNWKLKFARFPVGLPLPLRHTLSSIVEPALPSLLCSLLHWFRVLAWQKKSLSLAIITHTYTLLYVCECEYLCVCHVHSGVCVHLWRPVHNCGRHFGDRVPHWATDLRIPLFLLPHWDSKHTQQHPTFCFITCSEGRALWFMLEGKQLTNWAVFPAPRSHFWYTNSCCKCKVSHRPVEIHSNSLPVRQGLFLPP